MTDPNGFYELIVDYGWSGIVTPSKTGYTFEPNSIVYDTVADDPNDGYTAVLNTFIISGYAVDSEMLTPLEGVLYHRTTMEVRSQLNTTAART